MSKYEDSLAEQMNIETWPHQFTKNGNAYQVGEITEGIVSGHGDPKIVQPMVCVHCFVEFASGKDVRPPDPCPARNRKRELKRILS